MLRHVARVCSKSSATSSNTVRSLGSAASQSFSSDINSKAPEFQAKQQEDGGMKWDWVNDPAANPRMLPMEAFGSGMDLDRIESTTVEVYSVSSGEEHGQAQNELLADDEDM